MLENIPQHVIDRLSSSAYLQAIDTTIQRFKLDNKQIKALAQASFLVIDKKHTPDELQTLVQKNLNVEENVAHDIALEYIGFQLLPLQDYVGDVTGLIKKMGGDLVYFQKQAEKILTPEEMLFERYRYMLGDAHMSIDEYSVEQRRNFFTILISLAQKSINPDNVFGLLTKPIEKGGLGFSIDVAGEVNKEIISEFESGYITLDVFNKIDEIRKNVLGDQFTSIFTDRDVESVSKMSYELEKLKNDYQAFMQKDDVVKIVQSISVVDTNSETVKAKLYDAINSKDKEAFIVALGVLFASGKLKQLFKEDKRYKTFWRPKVLKAEGLETIRVFDENPARPKYLGAFVKFVLEKRFEMKEEESVMWGVYFASAAHHAGDYEYEHLAYGDTKTGTFVWSV